jgi:hypothetical protein
MMYRQALAFFAAIGLTLVSAQSAQAQTRCYQVRCTGAQVGPVGNPGVNPSHGYLPPLPTAQSGRDAADMNEEGAAWQRANAPAEAAPAPSATRPRAHPRRATSSRRATSARSHPPARARASTQRRAQPARAHARPTAAHPAATRRAARPAARPAQHPVPARNYNPIVDRASVYQATATGQSTTITQWSGRGESWQSGSVTTWIAPVQWSWQSAPMAGTYGPVMASQMCGWGQQSTPGQAPQATFLCHCPAGWRPPGWQAGH